METKCIIDVSSDPVTELKSGSSDEHRRGARTGVINVEWCELRRLSRLEDRNSFKVF